VLKAAFLSEEDNIALQIELKVEYIKLDYLCFIEELVAIMNADQSSTKCLANEMIYILNKIILDNIFKHVREKTPNIILNQIANRVFSSDLIVNNFYVNQILEAVNILFYKEEDLIDKYELENILSKKVYIYLNYLYDNNKGNIDNATIKLFEYMNSNFHFLDIFYYKFELMDFRKPILLYTERNRHVFT